MAEFSILNNITQILHSNGTWKLQYFEEWGLHFVVFAEYINHEQQKNKTKKGVLLMRIRFKSTFKLKRLVSKEDTASPHILGLCIHEDKLWTLDDHRGGVITPIKAKCTLHTVYSTSGGNTRIHEFAM